MFEHLLSVCSGVLFSFLLLPLRENFSASDEEDLFEPLSLPPSFLMDPCPTDDTPFQPLNPAGQQLVGRHIYYKWPEVGWCLGQIKGWNSGPSAQDCQFQGLLRVRPNHRDPHS